MKLIILSLLILSGCSTLEKKTPLPDQWVKSCGAISGTKATFCHYKTQNQKQATVWRMHGLLEGADLEKGFFDETSLKAMLNDIASDIIIISYGNGWMIRPPGTVGSPQFKEVQTRVIPFLESKFKLPRPYYALGMSMGGFNTLVIASYMPKFFDKIALTNPMLLAEDVDPFNIFQICPACLMYNTNFTQQEWKVANPYAFVRKNTAWPETFIESCPDDRFKLFEGGQEMALKIGAKFHREVTPCVHENPETAPVVEFLK